ncbi:DNA-binding protein [Streptomyces sp. NPDC002666]
MASRPTSARHRRRATTTTPGGGNHLMPPRDERRYPKSLLRVPQVPDDAWLSQPEAARQLGIVLFRIGVLITCGHLAPAADSAGRAGVTITSVEAEKSWRHSATRRAKARRLLKDTIRFF